MKKIFLITLILLIHFISCKFDFFGENIIDHTKRDFEIEKLSKEWNSFLQYLEAKGIPKGIFDIIKERLKKIQYIIDNKSLTIKQKDEIIEALKKDLELYKNKDIEKIKEDFNKQLEDILKNLDKIIDKDNKDVIKDKNISDWDKFIKKYREKGYINRSNYWIINGEKDFNIDFKKSNNPAHNMLHIAREVLEAIHNTYDSISKTNINPSIYTSYIEGFKDRINRLTNEKYAYNKKIREAIFQYKEIEDKYNKFFQYVNNTLDKKITMFIQLSLKRFARSLTNDIKEYFKNNFNFYVDDYYDSSYGYTNFFDGYDHTYRD